MREAGCFERATHLVVESHDLAMLFKSGAGLTCRYHAEAMGGVGGIVISLADLDDIRRADELRRQHARRALGPEATVLPWQHLQPSEQQRWLNEAADTDKERQ